MSKKPKEVVKELPKSPNEFTYRGNEQITITASEFLSLVKATEVAIKNSIETKFVSAPEWVSPITGIVVVNPTEEQMQTGEVIQVTSIEKTFSAGNFQESFAAWVYPDVIKSKELLLAIHKRQIDLGVAVPITQLQAEYQANQQAAAEAPVQDAEVVEPTKVRKLKVVKD